MSTETKNGIQVNNDALQKHNVTISRINIIKEHSATLKVEGVKDHSGLRKVTKTRKFIKGLRLDVEDRRKELNADLLKQLRDNNYVAKFITSELKPSEIRLRNIEKQIANEKEAIKLEKKRKALERLQKRIEQLNAFECAFVLEEVENATDQEFALMLTRAEIAYAEAQEVKRRQAQQLAEENSRLKEENEKLKQFISVPASEPVHVVVHDAVVIDNTEASVQPPASTDLTGEEKISIAKSVKEYALALKAVPVPEIKNNQVFDNARAQITSGINMLLKAVE